MAPRIPSYLHWILAQTDTSADFERSAKSKLPVFFGGKKGPVEKETGNGVEFQWKAFLEDMADANWSGCSADVFGLNLVSNGIADALANC